MTATISEIELTELVDLDSEVPCGWVECDNEAAWICRSECGTDGLHCTMHRQQWLNRANVSVFVNCEHCGLGPMLGWEQHFSWRSL